MIAYQTYSATTGVKHTFSYSRGADSSLGVGVSATGAYGSFTGSGTISKSSSITMDYPEYGNHRGVYYKTEFSWGKYLMSCSMGGRGAPVSHHYEARARGYYGGAKTSTAYIPTAKHCAYQQNGTKFTRTTSHAITWSDGADLAKVIGISLSAETGYSSDATVVYSFDANRYLCGTGGRRAAPIRTTSSPPPRTAGTPGERTVVAAGPGPVRRPGGWLFLGGSTDVHGRAVERARLRGRRVGRGVCLKRRRAAASPSAGTSCTTSAASPSSSTRSR